MGEASRSMSSVKPHPDSRCLVILFHPWLLEWKSLGEKVSSSVHRNTGTGDSGGREQTSAYSWNAQYLQPLLSWYHYPQLESEEAKTPEDLVTYHKAGTGSCPNPRNAEAHFVSLLMVLPHSSREPQNHHSRTCQAWLNTVVYGWARWCMAGHGGICLSVTSVLER